MAFLKNLLWVILHPIKIAIYFKQWLKSKKVHIIYLLIIANIIILANAYIEFKSWHDFYKQLISKEVYAKVIGTETDSEFSLSASAPEAEAELKIGSKEWILWKIKQAGIDPAKADCLIYHESGYNPNARNVNKSGSVDLGIFQWNTKYQIDTGYITIGCIGNPECEVDKFIAKVKQDNNFEAWHGYTNNCLWMGDGPFIK